MKIMQKVHDAPMAGYYGEKITREFLGKTFYWPEMKEDIEHYVCTCGHAKVPNQYIKKSLGYISPSQFLQVHLRTFQ